MMVKTSALNRQSKKPHIGRVKVKSGCRTCKARKVKCDEDWPACKRCVSTGRTCDGYGIWGGGGNGYGNRPVVLKGAKTRSHDVPCRQPAPMGTVASHERDSFEWFIRRAATKLRGVFVSHFWDKLMFQASANEPAVFHAVLALSTAHKQEVIDLKYRGKKAPNSLALESFLLQQYNKAIDHVQTVSNKDKASTRVALVTCLVFIFLEYLRGNYKTSSAHLNGGLKLLGEIQDSDDYQSTSPRNETDDWIIETFQKLCVHAEMFGQSPCSSGLFHLLDSARLSTSSFQSPIDARIQLDGILSSISLLSSDCSRGASSRDMPQRFTPPTRLKHVQSDLASWFNAYRLSTTGHGSQINARDAFAYKLLQPYYKMSVIMAETCLWKDEELRFDSHLPDFVSIITQSIEILKITSSAATRHKILLEDKEDHGGSVSDWGWIPPLYYTAVKCRNHRIRVQAIELLKTSPHKEGIWDSTIAVCVAQEVIELEEQEFYRQDALDNDFSPCSPLEMKDLLLPVLPESHRVIGLEVMLPADTTEEATLSCKRQRDDGSWELLARVYDRTSQCWIDKT